MSKKYRKASLRKKFSVLLVITVFLGLVIFAVTQLLHARSMAELDHSLALKKIDVSYCNGEKLDLFVPANVEPLPLVVYIHGGGWQYGSKEGDTFDMIKPLVKDGFAVASINYRLSGVAQFPAQVEDVFCSVRFLRSNARQYNLDSSRVGLVGISAGAHLAVLAANSPANATFTSGKYSDESNKVQAVVSMSGILDTEYPLLSETTDANLNTLLSGTEYTRKDANPSRYISQDDPPQLIIYGNRDGMVSPQQSIDYAKNARSAGINTQLIKVQNGNHNLQPFLLLGTKRNQVQLKAQIAKFFSEALATK